MREYELNYREKITVWVWERMQAHFGERWLKAFGTVWDQKREKARKKKPHLWPRMTLTAKLWADLLKDIPESAVARAVAAVTQPNRTELPTRPEFIALCHGDGVVERRTAAPEPETEEQREARLGRGKSVLGGLKAMVGSQSEKAA